MRVVGVDGCPGGWVVVELDNRAVELTVTFRSTFQNVVASSEDSVVIGIDIPIGLTNGPPRHCDLEARRLLGPRRASIFPAPIRQALDAPDHRTANAITRSMTGKGISIQAFNITRKVDEVDRVMRANPHLRDRVIEVHPEVSFLTLSNGYPMAHTKKRPEGFAERQALLATAFCRDLIPATPKEARQIAPYAGPDDLLDAIAACWTAHRYARGTARSLPAERVSDEYGLPMNINY